MTIPSVHRVLVCACALAGLLVLAPVRAHSVDEDLLDILLSNGSITQAQHEELITKLQLEKHTDHAPVETAKTAETDSQAAGTAEAPLVTESVLDEKIARQVTKQVDEATPVKASHGNKGFRFETADGNWQTNLQWRGQFRYTNPSSGDPRQLTAFDDENQSTFEARRLRMKIGGHGYRPWLKYYFDLDMQPTREADESSSNASARVLDWRVDVAKWDWGGIRVGQWKIDYNRERVDSSGRQQFVERSIINRAFTVDRQVGVQFRGHAFKNTRADLRWYLGAFTGEGRGAPKTDDNLMYVGRIQWNLFGRDLGLSQTDVEYTELPTASLAFGAATTEGSCTLWSSSGCGNLDGFTSPASAISDQFKIEQGVQEFAYKWRGFSLQQEYHRKEITDRLSRLKSKMQGGYLQTGYFFHNLFPPIPKPLEFAVRYAYVEEPNATDLTFDNERRELTLGANWFFQGHNNKLTVDFSRLRLKDDFIGRKESESRARLQWDISF